MDSMCTLSATRSQLWYQDEARSALARYLDHAVADRDRVAALVAGTAEAGAVQQHRAALADARRVLDAQGPFQVPPMVLTAAVHHWQARFDEAEARLRDAPRTEQSGWRIEKVTALVAVTALVEVDALRGLDRASTG